MSDPQERSTPDPEAGGVPDPDPEAEPEADDGGAERVDAPPPAHPFGEWAAGRAAEPSIGGAALHSAAGEIVARLRGVDSPEATARMRELLAAVVAIGSGLDLHATLQRIAAAATAVTGARYAAVGVVDASGESLSDFVYVGIDEDSAAEIGHLPQGKGLLGALIDHPEPLRLEDLALDRRSYGFPPHHPPMRSFLGVPIRVREAVFGNLYLTEKPGGFDESDEQVVLALAAAAGTAIENSRLYEGARRRERWVVGTSAVGNALLASESAADTRAAFSVVAEQLRELADGAVGMIAAPDGDGGLQVLSASGTGADLLTGAQAVASEFPAVSRLLRGEPVFLSDMSRSPDIAWPLARRFGPGMALPMTSAGRLLGAVAVWRSPGEAEFSADERRLATAFAAQAALALRIAEGQADQQRLAVYQDRDRIARDLHDLVIQRLFATGMMLEGAQRKTEVPEVKQRISKAVDELDATIKEVRTTIYALQHDDTPDGADDNLRTRVLREIGQSAAVLGFKPSVAFVGPVETVVGEQTGRQLVAALREMLSNAARHARARTVSVDVDAGIHIDEHGYPTFVLDEPGEQREAAEPTGGGRREGGRREGAEGEPAAGEADRGRALEEALRRAGAGRPAVMLSVSDDGVGIPEGGRRSGLRNLADRARGLGGAAWHEPGPGGRGTTVRWTALL
ncbi:GAF domain-containing protein [Phaeacidiphilus oryzae]|uniref:GAF domain-containing protein n=1 Tax=Phaeacidiphilus oryzae TaxID=348818 RepID=UPI0007C7E1AD|nr:GAF domain-containing protein [Phaeacidiphilus oryzae]